MLRGGSVKDAFSILLLLCASGPAVAEDSRCISNYGQTVCGYHCISNYGQVKCARTPAGACAANYGQIVCWDPPGRAHRRQRWGARADCLSNYGTIACGYGCVANYGRVKCAQTPGAQCYANNGQLVCSDGT